MWFPFRTSVKFRVLIYDAFMPHLMIIKPTLQQIIDDSLSGTFSSNCLNFEALDVDILTVWF